MPHCRAACSRNFCCNGCRPSGLAMPSIVVTSCPDASTPSTQHELTRTPSRMTLQAPQLPLLHPSLLPVSPRTSRSTSNKLWRGSHRNSTSSPLSRVCTYTFVGIVLPLLGSLNGASQRASREHSDQVSSILRCSPHVIDGASCRLCRLRGLLDGLIRDGFAAQRRGRRVHQQWRRSHRPKSHTAGDKR